MARRDVCLIPADNEPITASWAKTHSRITTTADDQIIEQQYLFTARETVENDTSRLFMKQTRTLFLDDFPNVIEIKYNPVRALVSIKYIDQDGVEQTFALSKVVTDPQGEFFRITLADGESWPITDDQPGAVRITYRAGYAVAPSSAASNDTFTASDHDLSDGDAVRLFTLGGTLPGQNSAGTYFVINATASTFQLSSTSGGSAVTLSDQNEGDFLVVIAEGAPFWIRMSQALLLLFGHYYEHREAVVTGTIVTEIKRAYSDLVNSISRNLF